MIFWIAIKLKWLSSSSWSSNKEILLDDNSNSLNSETFSFIFWFVRTNWTLFSKVSFLFLLLNVWPFSENCIWVSGLYSIIFEEDANIFSFSFSLFGFFTCVTWGLSFNVSGFEFLRILILLLSNELSLSVFSFFSTVLSLILLIKLFSDWFFLDLSPVKVFSYFKSYNYLIKLLFSSFFWLNSPPIKYSSFS